MTIPADADAISASVCRADAELPPMPNGKYDWWDDYYDGLRLSEEPEDRYRQLGLYDEDQMREYALLAIQQERERCARLCETLDHGAFGPASFLQGVTLGSVGCAKAIRKG